MARNRMIKPDFWSSSTLNSISRDARLTFIGIWNFCDDYGFCLNSTRSLIGDIFPCDESVNEDDLKKWINELIEVKLLIPLEYKKKRLIFVKGWSEHQTIANKSKRSYVESVDLEEVINEVLDTNKTLISNYLDTKLLKRKKKEETESKKDKEENKKETDYPFELFWKMYDKKVGKPKCEKKYEALSEEVRAEIFEHVLKYIEAQPEKQYRKNPETYLNQKSWEDEIIESKNTSKTFSQQQMERQSTKGIATAEEIEEASKNDTATEQDIF